MNTFTATFDYEGRAPTESFVKGVIESAGYTNLTKISVVEWEIKTRQSEETVQNGLDIAVENEGKYTGGKLTSVTVE